MAEQEQWQMAVSRELDQREDPKLRVSSAGRCPRALGYAALAKEESNPPGQQALNRMALGHMAEILIIKEMEKNGWETENTVLSRGGQMELELEIPNTGGVKMTGHPDGKCRHEELTRNFWIPLECKSMSPDKGEEIQKDKIITVYPGYLAQISLYGREMKRREEVNHGERGIFGMMDREGRLLPPERATWKKEYVDQLLEKTAAVVNLADKGEVQDRPYAQSSTECRYCNYHSLCWGTELKPEPESPNGKKTVTSKEPQVMEAARTWAELKPRVDKARDMLQAVSNSNDMADVEVEGIIGGYFQPRSERLYDSDALEKSVPADILKRCMINAREKLPAFWVRPSRR